MLDSALHQGLLTAADRLTLPTHLSGRRGAHQARAPAAPGRGPNASADAAN
ncbi:hypothetical protein [Streptomyces sp. NPDC097640]|uniref:hypothetical protein n=1 Tax=Streptomyces sp. NPDC097640 TaxID=3157229 RepID=UPI00331F26C6